MASWRYILHPYLSQTYIPVARLPEEHKWRKICVTLDTDLHLNGFNLHDTLCKELRKGTEELDKNNISSSEVWLAQIYRRSEFHLNNIGEGSCSQFGRNLLLLTRCFKTAGKLYTNKGFHNWPQGRKKCFTPKYTEKFIV